MFKLAMTHKFRPVNSLNEGKHSSDRWWHTSSVVTCQEVRNIQTARGNIKTSEKGVPRLYLIKSVKLALPLGHNHPPAGAMSLYVLLLSFYPQKPSLTSIASLHHRALFAITLVEILITFFFLPFSMSHNRNTFPRGAQQNLVNYTVWWLGVGGNQEKKS